jgi:hypothetical protein
MLILIVFIIKTLIATVIGMFLGYINKSFNGDEKIIPIIILTVISSAAFSVSTNIEIFFLASFIMVYSIVKSYKINIKIIYYCACIAGLLIGLGNILEAIFFCIVIYSIYNNRESIENFFSDKEQKIENE